MRITRDNYESYLVDYSEGMLSANLRHEVENFLILNPDIQEEFEMFNNSRVQIADVNYTEKESLKKIPFKETSASSDYFQQLCVAHIENLLPDSERKFLEKLVKEDAEKQIELALFEKTKLIIEKLNFNEKILLKQPEIIHEITDANFEEYCIACMEGWLDQSGLVELNNYIQRNPNQNKVLHSYYKTRLTADLSIVYPNKNKIKRFTILTANFKKYVSIASSVAAIVVLGFMIFYTTTLDNKPQLAGNVASSFIENKQEPKQVNSAQHDELTEKSSKNQIPSVMHDPFGFEKISGKELQPGSSAQVNERFVVNRIQPIRFQQIECPPCTQVFVSKSLVKTTPESLENTTSKKEENETSNPNKNIGNTEEKPAWVLAQAGIAGFNKITNSELKVEKNREQNKTRIAFNSKFFSFSTQVNNN